MGSSWKNAGKEIPYRDAVNSIGIQGFGRYSVRLCQSRSCWPLQVAIQSRAARSYSDSSPTVREYLQRSMHLVLGQDEILGLTKVFDRGSAFLDVVIMPWPVTEADVVAGFC